ncbi:peroxiredoxin [Chelatococcus sambhunathii]|uniref:Glutathione-dependent peroxiredoxin n=1 Tax=Chelatococcus sambhunathii TaxID=363953 RepID=A0ABU1DJR5_9HYPH|nr:peroxiredoxin [Chelatococcus sambhunathii]MDR4308263.1 peroxiredoxin [Chelatococcus sambhunathii]
MTIEVGARLPNTTFRRLGPAGPETVMTEDVFAGKKAVLFAVPGAFTPTCHRNHLPGYLNNLDALREKGVEVVAVTSVNDPFVMDAWADATGAKGVLEFLSDGNGDFAKAIGLDLDASGGGLGLRSKRYAMVLDDMTVTHLAVEDSPGKADLSSAEKTLAAL